MIAKHPGKCVRCHAPIVPGALIAGESRAWYHEDCNAPAPTGVAVNSGPRPANPGAAMTDKQLGLIGDLLTERVFTQGEASTFIEYLKGRPRKEEAPAVNLAERLAS